VLAFSALYASQVCPSAEYSTVAFSTAICSFSIGVIVEPSPAKFPTTTTFSTSFSVLFIIVPLTCAIADFSSLNKPVLLFSFIANISGSSPL